MLVRLRPPAGGDAEILFPMVHGTDVVDTIVWDGPASIDELRQGLEARRVVGEGQRFYVIEVDGEAVGACDLRREDQRTGLGLWIGKRYQGRGIGTEVVEKLTEIAFDELGTNAVFAAVFVGNAASRRVFEKCGYTLQETLPRAVCKRGEWIDEWLFRIGRNDRLPGASSEAS